MKLYQLGYIFTAGALLHCLQELTHFVSLWNLLCAWEEKIASEHAVKLSKLLCDIGCVTGLSPMGTVEHLLDTVCYNSSSLTDVDKCLQMLCSPLCCAGIQHNPNVASLLDSQLTSVSEYHSLSSIRGRLASTQIFFFYICFMTACFLSRLHLREVKFRTCFQLPGRRALARWMETVCAMYCTATVWFSSQWGAFDGGGCFIIVSCLLESCTAQMFTFFSADNSHLRRCKIKHRTDIWPVPEFIFLFI